MCGATALAGNLTLLFSRHRRESTPFFAFTCSHRSALRLIANPCTNDVRTLQTWFRRWILDPRRTRLVERRLRYVVRVLVLVVFVPIVRGQSEPVLPADEIRLDSHRTWTFIKVHAHERREGVAVTC
jgi:hypothetical protein